jgi:hypothetical protein
MLWKGVDRGAPLWLGVLQMAEAWATPPWEIMDAEGSLVWANRWAFYRKQVRWVEEQQREKKWAIRI